MWCGEWVAVLPLTGLSCGLVLGPVYFFILFLPAADISCCSTGPACLHHCCQLPGSDAKIHCCPTGPACPCCFLPLLWGLLLHLAQLSPASGPHGFFLRKCCTEVFTTSLVQPLPGVHPGPLFPLLCRVIASL